MEWHEIAKIFPMLEEDDLERLTEDIRDGSPCGVLVEDGQ